ncbi:MAG: pilin [Parcubacteria group bacterium]
MHQDKMNPVRDHKVMNNFKHKTTTDAQAHPISNGMNKKILASVLSLTIFFALGSLMVYAQTGGTGSTGGTGGSGATGGTGGTGNTGGTGGTGSTGQTQNVGITIPNPLKGGDSLFELLSTIIDKILLPIGGILAVLAFIYSGFLYVTAQGNQTKIETAHRALLYTAMGTAVLLGAWVIARVICGTLEQIGAPACGI